MIIEVTDLNKFVTVCIDALDSLTLSKKKFIRSNHLPFMNKEVLKKYIERDFETICLE